MKKRVMTKEKEFQTSSSTYDKTMGTCRQMSYSTCRIEFGCIRYFIHSFYIISRRRHRKEGAEKNIVQLSTNAGE